MEVKVASETYQDHLKLHLQDYIKTSNQVLAYINATGKNCYKHRLEVMVALQFKRPELGESASVVKLVAGGPARETRPVATGRDGESGGTRGSQNLLRGTPRKACAMNINDGDNSV
ncbi:hypothetical protein ElyMa_000582500 [Elysia marginata]|uniref:Uncharacterized protein n=1 Tax=Elysia marginata TaxID=1093978 RepID=A0AAV4G661_9GAST|nr:hypothetical protein ElyMa_000582500 [Elysia marginata]